MPEQANRQSPGLSPAKQALLEKWIGEDGHL